MRLAGVACGTEGTTVGQLKRGQQFLFVGNHPCLDFINTQLVIKDTPTDLLETFDDLMAWLVESNMVQKQEAEAVSKQLTPNDQAEILEQAKALRATLRAMARQMASGNGVPKAAVAAINALLRSCQGYREVVRNGQNFKQHFIPSANGKDELLASLAMAGSDLLTSADATLIKKCKNPACVLYFYDTTKNHARNWCSMQLCGNRDKVAAYFKRQRKSSRTR
jgi:predicted RNA-binding Zn ribbon-like protein